MAIPPLTDFEGLLTIYSESELRQAIAIAQAIKQLGAASGGGGGGGGGGDASAANQIQQTAVLNLIKDGVGLIGDNEPTDPSDDASLLGYIKGVYYKIEQLNDARLANLEADVEEIRGNFMSTTNVITGNLIGINQATGSRTDSISPGATANSSLIGLFKFLNNAVSAIQGLQLGVSNDAYPTTDTEVNTLLGGLRRIVGRLSSLLPQSNGKLATESTLPVKSSIAGFTSVAAINNNLLDSSGNGVATNVRNYQSGSIVIISTAIAGSWLVSSAHDSAFTQGIKNAQIQEVDVLSANPLLGNITATASTRKFVVNLQGVNYLRISCTANAGITALAVFNQSPHSPLQYNVQQSVAGNLNANVSGSLTTVATVSSLALIGIPVPNIDVATAAITTSATTAAFTPTGGIGYIALIAVNAISGTSPLLQIDIQESIDSGANWFTVYSFAPITATGVYQSPKIPISGNRIRYVQTVAGTNPSFTRSIIRSQINDATPVQTLSKRFGGFAVVDVPVWGRLSRISTTNTTPSVVYLQIHSKATALTEGDVPIDVYVVPVGATFSTNLGVYGYGIFLGTNIRIGLSSTLATYTANATAGTSLTIGAL